MKKKCMTLLEIMIVIFLISLIGSVVGYNMKGSLDKGKAFKTEQSINQIKDILLLEATQSDKSYDDIALKAKKIIQDTNLVKDVDALFKDGWGNPLKVTANLDGFDVVSEKYDKYKKKK